MNRYYFLIVLILHVEMIHKSVHSWISELVVFGQKSIVYFLSFFFMYTSTEKLECIIIIIIVGVVVGYN